MSSGNKETKAPECETCLFDSDCNIGHVPIYDFSLHVTMICTFHRDKETGECDSDGSETELITEMRKKLNLPGTPNAKFNGSDN